MIEAPIRLRRAIYVDDLHIVQRILKNNPQQLILTNPDSFGNTSLHLCAQHGRLAIAQYLIDVVRHDEEGPSRNNAGNTPLHVACAEGHEEVVRFLATRWPRWIDCRNRLGATPLMEACKRGWDGVVEILLHSSADPDLTDSLGNTALHHASAYGHLKVIRTLIERGVSPDRPNRQGWKPLSYSYTFEAEACFQQLLHELELRKMHASERDQARARAATPVFGRSERVLPGRQRASSGS